jgi:hypothetical protein
MSKKKGFIEEFWEDASPPIDTEAILKEFFDEFADFVDPQSYGAGGVLRSIVKLFAEFIE